MRLTIVRPQPHISVGMEIVDEFNLVFMSNQEVSDCTSFRLTERMSSSVVTSTRIGTGSFLLGPGNSIVAVEVNSEVSIITTISIMSIYVSCCCHALRRPVGVHVLSLEQHLSGLLEVFLDDSNSVDVDYGYYVINVLYEHVNVILPVVDVAVEELEDGVEGHLDGSQLSRMVCSSDHDRRLLQKSLFDTLWLVFQ